MTQAEQAHTPTLLPCPFCGLLPKSTGCGEGNRGLMIYCVNEEGCVNTHISRNDHAEAIASWNTRADASNKARIEALEKALRFMLVDPPATLDEPDTDAEVIRKYREKASAALQSQVKP